MCVVESVVVLLPVTVAGSIGFVKNASLWLAWVLVPFLVEICLRNVMRSLIDDIVQFLSHGLEILRPLLRNKSTLVVKGETLFCSYVLLEEVRFSEASDAFERISSLFVATSYEFQ